MALVIRVEGEWGDALPSRIAAVATSVASAFPSLTDETLAILLEPTPSVDDAPVTLFEPSPSGEVVVRLNIRGTLWARCAYQFAHEFCHVLADIRTWPGQQERFAWIEEVICETASLFALRSMAQSWALDPPYPQWQEYSADLATYVAEHMEAPRHSLPAGASFATWLATQLPALESNLGLREAHAVIAKEILPIFESDDAGWRAVRSLHRGVGRDGGSTASFIAGWADASPPVCRPAIEAIAATIGVS